MFSKRIFSRLLSSSCKTRRFLNRINLIPFRSMSPSLVFTDEMQYRINRWMTDLEVKVSQNCSDKSYFTVLETELKEIVTECGEECFLRLAQATITELGKDGVRDADQANVLAYWLVFYYYQIQKPFPDVNRMVEMLHLHFDLVNSSEATDVRVRNICMLLSIMCQIIYTKKAELEILFTDKLVKFLIRVILKNNSNYTLLFALMCFGPFSVVDKLKSLMSRQKYNLKPVLERLSSNTEKFNLESVYNRDRAYVLNFRIGECAQWLLDYLFGAGTTSLPIEKCDEIKLLTSKQFVDCLHQITRDNYMAFGCDHLGQNYQCSQGIGPASGGAFYYEAILLTQGSFHVGWALKIDLGGNEFKDFKDSSISFDPYKKKINMHGVKEYHLELPPIKPCDVIGCLLDTSPFSGNTFKFYLNGEIREDFTLSKYKLSSTPYFPTACLSAYQQVYFNFGQTPFRFAPSDVKFRDIFGKMNNNIPKVIDAEKEVKREELLIDFDDESEDTKDSSAKSISTTSSLSSKMKIFIKTITGKKVPVKVQPTATVANLKFAFFQGRKEHVPPWQFRMIFAGRNLENHQTLAHYKICNECTVHCVLRMGGGASEFKPTNGQRLKNDIGYYLESNVQGPFEAIETIEKIFRRIMFGYLPDEKPLVLLFIGVGLCDQLRMAESIASYPDWSHYLVNSGGEDLDENVIVDDCKRSFIRIDMNEFKTQVTGFYDRIASVLTECQNAVIVFEEIEQAHPDVFVDLLKLFNQTPMNDCQGNKIVVSKDFIFIMTSNLAREEIFEYTQRLEHKHKHTTDNPAVYCCYKERFSTDLDFKCNAIWPIVKQHFKRDNFIGRIDEMVCFLPLSHSELIRFVRHELNKFSDLIVKMKITSEYCSGHIKLGHNHDVLDFFVSKYKPTEGTRSITREIKHRVVDVLLRRISMQSVLPRAFANLVVSSTGEKKDVIFETNYGYYHGIN